MSNNSKKIGTWQRALALAAFAGMSLPLAGCIEDTDCGVCDPDNLVLEAISGINYASDKVQLLSPSCDGPSCPEPLTKGTYFIEEIGPCEQTEEALETPSPEEYCRLSPLVTAFGIEFIFNNLLEATSMELVRKRPDNPNLFEVYDWKVDILSVEGPITRFNGDYQRGGTDEPDTVSRLVNLTCIENLREQGIDYSFEDYQDPATNPCNAVQGNRPLKMRDGLTKSYRGSWTAGSNSCSSPEEGPDTCCTRCDWLLSTRIARYGLSSPSTDANDWRNQNLALTPNNNSAIVCQTDGSEDIPDKFEACSDFIIGIDRADEEGVWYYDRGEGTLPYPMPEYDWLRELHPDQRPAERLSENSYCTATSQCGDVHNLSGTECIGKLDGTGASCLADATKYNTEFDAEGEPNPDFGRCQASGGRPGGFCQPQWFVTCRFEPDTTGGETAYCLDRRFATTGTAACWRSTSGFDALCDENGENCTRAQSNTPLAFCDGNENNRLTGLECCQDDLGGPDGTCSPFTQTNLRPVPRYQRDENLPESTRNCVCQPLGDLDSEELASCETAIRTGCYDSEGEFIDSREGQYAVKFVSGVGGVVYDPALKGFDWRPADTGLVGRADIEACAEGNVDRLVGAANRHDGWRANETGAESQEDFDRGMCSGQTYTVTFAEPGNDASNPVLADKVGNTLEGKSVYTFETAQYHIVPQSGFPTDNLRIGACDAFSIRTSNKYDMSPENLAKLQIWRIDEAGNLTTPNDDCGSNVPVAGGPGCAPDKATLDMAADPCLPPCLTIDVANQIIGEVEAQIDPTEFGPILETGETYRFVVPMAASVDQAFGDPDIYRAAFWDVCGMPLVAQDAIPYDYDFSIDRPKCKEDVDQDNVQLSCDNAPDFFNPDQGDIDGDGVGDVIDLCPTVAGSANNTADSDRDGVGNECDTCTQTLTQYNQNADMLGVSAYMQVRNIPYQDDTDGDGIGDVCDNCILTANCEDYGAGNPYQVGDPIAFDDNNICQRDDDTNMIGDACDGAGMVNMFAAGPIGLGDLDDFDQDGVANGADACPRQPLTDTITCSVDEDCPTFIDTNGEMDNRKCELYDGQDTGVCDHLDSDGDEVGDICDTCAFAPNPMQTIEGGAQEDDEDGDFVGASCETSPQCADTEKDPRPYGFYEVQANGNCCTVALVEAEDGSGDLLNAFTGNPLEAPHDEDASLTVPVRVTCSQDQVDRFECRQLPARVAQQPGILSPPPGCDDALMAAGISAQDNVQNRLTDLDFDGDLGLLLQTACFLPQFDQDFDGLGDPCDLCPFDFDPDNQPYIDVNGRVWPNDGRFCNGEYSIDNKCDDDEVPGGETDGGTDGDDTDGDDSGTGTGGG